jgi:hypothetical protein
MYVQDCGQRFAPVVCRHDSLSRGGIDSFWKVAA